jgi:hypothetical protein
MFSFVRQTLQSLSHVVFPFQYFLHSKMLTVSFSVNERDRVTNLELLEMAEDGDSMFLRNAGIYLRF